MLLVLMFLISYLCNPLLCMKEEAFNTVKRSLMYFKTECDPFITDACFLPNNKIAVSTRNNEIRVFDYSLQTDNNLGSFQQRIVSSETENNEKCYIEHIFYNKKLLFVFSNKHIDEQMAPLTDMTIFKWTDWDKSIKDSFTFQNVSLLFFDAKTHVIGLQSTQNSLCLKGISYKDEKIEPKELYCDDPQETITSATYHEKEQLCLLTITKNAIPKVSKLDSCNQPKSHSIKLISFKNHEMLWQKSHHASHCVFNPQGTYFAYCCPSTKKVYIRDIFNKSIVFKGSLMVNIESLRALIFDKNNVIKEVTEESFKKEKTHYNKDRSRTITITPENVNIESIKN